MSGNGANTDKEFVKLLGTHILNAKGFYDYGIKRGLATPEDMKLTIAARQKTAQTLVNGGMSQRQAAKALGVTQTTISRDVKHNVSKIETKSVTGKDGKNPATKPKKAKATSMSADDPIQEPYDPDCITDQQRWEWSLGHFAGDAVAMRAFWTRQFGDWEKFKVPSPLVKLVEQAAKAWAEFASELTREEK